MSLKENLKGCNIQSAFAIVVIMAVVYYFYTKSGYGHIFEKAEDRAMSNMSLDEYKNAALASFQKKMKNSLQGIERMAQDRKKRLKTRIERLSDVKPAPTPVTAQAVYDTAKTKASELQNKAKNAWKQFRG